MTRCCALLPLALAALLCPALCAAPGDPLPVGDGFRAVFDEKGVWRLEGEQGVFLARCGLRLWSGGRFLHQSNARPAKAPNDRPAGRAFEGTLTVGGQPVRYWQLATPVPDGLLVQYAVAAPGLAATDELAAGLDLPVGTFAGGTCAVGGAEAVAFPKAKAAPPRLFERQAQAVVVRRNSLVLSVQRRSAGRIIVQDGREWDNPYFQALLYADRAVGDPEGWRSVAFLVTVGEPRRQPVVGAVVSGKGALPCYDAHEAEVVFWAPWGNPFRDVRVWAEVATPSGRQFAAGGFYTRDHERSRDGEEEVLEPVGVGRWRIRIAPTEVGVHSYVVKVAAGGAEGSAKAIAFEASGADAPGFLRRPTTQSRYFETERGKPVFLIGHNYCWPASRAPTYDWDAALKRMADAGINATRLWLCSWGIGIEGSRPDDYRLADAWRLDHALRRAREHGVYVQLCLDNFADLTGEESAKKNPYLARNGGPCRTATEFFTLPQAIAQHRRRLDYLVARYAPFASVLAWELCNEMDYAAASRRDPALLAWARETAAYLRDRDPYGHVVTTSLGIGSVWDGLWKLKELDAVQAHAYIHRPVYVRDRTELDAAALVLRQVDALARFGKPLVVAEFGFLGTRDFNPLNDADRTGIHLHNALWASALAGCAGTALHWWWDTYLPERDLYYHYAALARFLAKGPLPDAQWGPLRDKGGGPVRVVGLRGPAAALLWIQHRDNGWYRRLVKGKDATPLPRTTLDLARLTEGRYRIEWWDTYAGQPLTHTQTATAGGKLTLRVPPGHPDIACKVRRVGD